MKKTTAYGHRLRTRGKALLLLWGLLCGASAASAQTLVWEDNFDGTTINPNNWTYDFGDGCERGNCGWGNQELEYYTSRPENARLENGSLRIEARRESFQGKPFTSARLKTYGRVHFKYGTLEARIKVPNLQNGLWPAFWMLGTTGNWPASGEIDMMEMGAKETYPDNVNKWASAAVHWSFKGSQADYGQLFKSTTSLTDDYHVYKLVWNTTFIRVFIDNTEFFTVDISKPETDMEEFHRPQYVLLNLAVGGNYTGKMGAGDITAPLPAAMLVDYIRLYQNPGDELYLGKDHAFAGDYGVYSERSTITDKLVYDGTDANLYCWNNLTNITTPAPVPFEGQEVLAVHAASGNWFGMGVENQAKNLSNFAGGSLRFQFKTTYTGQFKVGVKSGFGESWINFPAGGAAQYGLVRDGAWHEVAIPLSAFDQPNAGMHIDLGSMNALFMFAGDPATSAADFYFDDIRYTGGVAANPPPTVAITAPANEAVITTPASLPITASAADANGTVAKVEFYQGSTKLGEATASPYTYTWASPPAGAYVLTAKATDNEGATTTSSPITVYVAAPGNTAPTISLTSPAANASFVTPASITLTADAADANGIYKVDFYQGTTLLATDYTAPYSYTWGGARAGSYALTAKATDTGGATAMSAAVTVTVTDPIVPTVSITAPTSGTTLNAPASLTIAATAADANGTITKVEFYQGSTKLGEDATAPYTYDWANVPAGSYSLTAKATDNDGNATTSAAVALEVKAVPCTGTAASGDYRYEVYTSAGNVTYTFHPLGTTAGGNLAIIYLREGATGAYPGYGMTKNAAGDFTFTRAIADGTVTSFYFTYQVGAGGPEKNSADAPHTYTVGMACGGTPTNTAPTVSLTSPTANTTFAAPASITLTATAADADGTVAKVEFFQGTTKLGEATASPYTYTWTGVAAGTYALTAKATDNGGASTTSAAVSVTVTGTTPSPGSGYCATTDDFAFKAETTGGNVTFTFHPLGTTAGGNLALIYLREGATGGYPGYTMTKNAAGDFTFTKAIASGTVTSIYFTYQVGAGGPERNTAATPLSYTVGTSCATPLASRQSADPAATFSVYPNPASQGRTAITFTLAQAASYEVALYDLKGARLQAIGAGSATGSREVTLELRTAGLANGIYLLKMVSDNTVLTKRLVVNR